MKTYTYYIHQMHCASCKILVNDALASIDLKNPEINLKTKQISFDTSLKPSEFLPSLSAKLAEYSYILSDNPKLASTSLLTPFLLSLLFLAAYLLLELLGFSKLFNPQKITYPAIFILGLIASVSSCVALVGGLILGLPSSLAAHLQFHLSRLVSFFVLGGAIGLLGQNFALSSTLHSLLLILVSLSMLLLGLSNLNIKSIQTLTLPNVLGNKLGMLKNSNNPLLPLILGTLTFILPCGFTQSMQLYSLTLGSPSTSAFTMLFFALGTLPVLGLISFTSHHFSSGKYSDTFLKTIGFILVYLSLFNLKNILGL